MQLERILHSQGFGSRKLCRILCYDERVAVNGELCDDPSADIATEGLVLTVDGEDWPYFEKAYLMLNKPAGYECSLKPQYHPGVHALLPTPLRQSKGSPEIAQILQVFQHQRKTRVGRHGQ